ncbi:MAG: putative DNA-binding domain-containing protein [Woeseia sp.]
MPDVPDFQQKQYAFAAHIRDPEHQPAPDGIEDRRMAIYRELFFNNLNQLLGKGFPVLKTLYGDDGWRRLVRQFMAHHQAQTPYFLELPKEFVRFLETGYKPADDDPPFLAELAHYEWVELALSVSNETDPLDDIDAGGDLLESVPVKSKLAWVLNYRFPVHRISRKFQPHEPGEQPTFLAVYRRRDDDVGFMELNPVTARLLEMIEANATGQNGRELLLALAQEIAFPDPDALVGHGAAAMEEMRGADILVGTLRTE